MLMKEAQERMELVGKNTVAKVFTSKHNNRYLYPYGLAGADRPANACRESCYEMIVDSGFNNEDVTNRRVMRKAVEENADYVVPKDYPGERLRTRESMREFFKEYDQQKYRPTPFVVLQPDYATEYLEAEEFYDQFNYFALGGLQQFESEEQVERLREFREVVGNNVYVHAFGVGTSLKFVKALRQNNSLVDSLDVSTGETAIKNNKIPDRKWMQTPFYIPKGVNSTSVRARFSAGIVYMLNYVLGPDVGEGNRTVDQVYDEKTVLCEFNEAVESSDVSSRHEVSIPTDDDGETMQVQLGD